MGLESSDVVRFDLRSLLQGRMWSLIPLMVYISLIIGHRGFGCEDNLYEIMCPKSFAGFRFYLGPLRQGQMWFFIPIMAYISSSLVIGRRGFGCEDNL